MSLSSIELWQRVTESGLASTEDCRRWAIDISRSLSVSEQSNGDRVIAKLVELKRLTGYQARVVLGQSQSPLRIGGEMILGRVKSPPFAGWFESKQRALPDAPSSFLRPVDREELLQLRPFVPNLNRLRRLQTLEHSHLQATLPAEIFEGKLLVRMRPAAGALLIDAPPQSVDAVSDLVAKVSSALATLHRRGIVHGHVLPDRIVLDSNLTTLLIDPLCSGSLSLKKGLSFSAMSSQAQTQTGDGPSKRNVGGGLLQESLGRWRVEQFAAPELQAPGQQANMATDVYSLGCVWWWLLVGSPPAAGRTVAEVMAQHAAGNRTIPSRIKMPASMAVCLLHCLAADPSARFASAIELHNALEAAMRTSSESSLLNVNRSASDVSDNFESNSVSSDRKSVAQDSSATVPSARSVPAKKRRANRGVPWLIPAVVGSLLLITLLLAIQFSGLLDGGSRSSGRAAMADRAATVSKHGEVAEREKSSIATDPRAAAYTIVDSREGILWAPPSLPDPIPLDLLPPGGRLFLGLRLRQLLTEPAGRIILAAFDEPRAGTLMQLAQMSGVDLEEVEEVCIAFYATANDSQLPQLSYRFRLHESRTLRELKLALRMTSSETIGDQSLLLNNDGFAMYVAQQPLLEGQSVTDFSIGPLDLMRDVAQAEGGRVPLTLALEKVWKQSDRKSDFAMICAPSYLLTEGRVLLQVGPDRLTEFAKDLFSDEVGAFSIQMRFEPTWYVESMWVGSTDQAAGKILVQLQTELGELPSRVERWFVESLPHPAWRGLALRFPQMLRVLNRYSRFGIENGMAVVNAHLPTEAAPNILLASWFALQDSATASANFPMEEPLVAPKKSLTTDEVLSQTIKMNFDQEPIETALRLVAEEANDNLPEGVSPVRFELDGAAFGAAGITRNQQLRNFRIEGESVRAALTEIAKRGNPTAGVADLRMAEQKLVWVVVDDPKGLAGQRILLTTRDAAQAAGWDLPTEFK